MAIQLVTDEDIQRDVLEELRWDPEVEVTDVGVEVDDRVVTLTGTVDSFFKKWVAERAALRVRGVRAVANEIEVRLPTFGELTDTEIARAVANALEWNRSVPFERIDITVEDGRVTLEGEVEWNYQSAVAESIARGVSGVRSVTNLIRVKQPQVSADEIASSIEQALVRNAQVDAQHINVEVDGDHVTLSGTVRSWAEKQEAEDAAWRAPGVASVTNNINIEIS